MLENCSEVCDPPTDVCALHPTTGGVVYSVVASQDIHLVEHMMHAGELL